jgi:hypothetical protein
MTFTFDADAALARALGGDATGPAGTNPSLAPHLCDRNAG